MLPGRPRRFRLLARLAVSVFGGFALVLAGFLGVSVYATATYAWRRAGTYARLQLAYARAGVLAASGETAPRAEAVETVRRHLATVEPGLVLGVFDHGMAVGGSLAPDALDGEGLSMLRAGQPAPVGVRDPAYPGQGGFRFYAPLASDPEVVVSIRFPLELRQGEIGEGVWPPLLMAGLVLMVVCLGLYLVLRRTTTRITALAQAVAGMAESGDFTSKLVPDVQKDEIGDLSIGVLRLTMLLRTTASALLEATSKLNAAGAALTATATEHSEAMRVHARAMDEATTSAKEIRRSSEASVRRAEQEVRAASRASGLGEAGEEAVRETLEALGDIRGQVQSIAERIVMVAERAQQISSITQSVKEIAKGSNMLALNAAIEAVRSGEKGTGFSTVAREMRNLSDQSTRATERVREILEDVSAAIRQASASSSSGTQRIEGVLDRLGRSGDSVRTLSRMVVESSQSARAIAAEVQQQNEGIARIIRSLADQQALSERASERLALTLKHAEELQSLTGLIDDLLKPYRF